MAPFTADADLPGLMSELLKEPEPASVDPPTHNLSATSAGVSDTEPYALQPPAGSDSPERRTPQHKPRPIPQFAIRIPVIAAALLLLAAGGWYLPGILLRVETPAGTIVLEYDQPELDGAVVSVDGKQQVTIMTAGAVEPITVSADVGRRLLEVAKGGFKTFTEEFEVEAGKERDIRVRLEPLAAGKTAPESPGAFMSEWQPTPEQQAFFDEVAKLPAAEQIEAVREKLMEVNPEFDGTLNHSFDRGEVVELHLGHDGTHGTTARPDNHLTDIWPVRALAKLESLSCNRNPNLWDLRPLTGMPLRHLETHATAVSDLSPLRDMPLTNLNCASTEVSDLSPLRGLPLKSLGCWNTPVSDLSPLMGMPLFSLDCARTGVSDYSPLASMPLERLVISIPLFHQPDEDLVRSLDGLRNLASHYRSRYNPPDTFWKEHATRKEAAEEFAAATAKLTPREQVKAATARLYEANGAAIGFAPDARDGAIGEATLTLPDAIDDSNTGEGVDVAPLRGLTGLTKLTITGGPHWLDLSALNSLPLEALKVDERLIRRNRAVLEGMPMLKTVNGGPAAEALAGARD